MKNNSFTMHADQSFSATVQGAGATRRLVAAAIALAVMFGGGLVLVGASAPLGHCDRQCHAD